MVWKQALAVPLILCVRGEVYLIEAFVTVLMKKDIAPDMANSDQKDGLITFSVIKACISPCIMIKGVHRTIALMLLYNATVQIFLSNLAKVVLVYIENKDENKLDATPNETPITDKLPITFSWSMPSMNPKTISPQHNKALRETGSLIRKCVNATLNTVVRDRLTK